MRSFHKPELASHRRWLGQQGDERLRRWESLLAVDEEAAIVEAGTQHFLGSLVDRMEPAEDLAQGGPDFRCFRAGHRFYVECTCIRESVVTDKTGLTPWPPEDAQVYGHLTQQVLNECKNKAKQCSGLDGPCLLAIGTLHCQAGDLCWDKVSVEDILTGSPCITRHIDTRTGASIGDTYESTDLADAAFCRKSNNPDCSLELARKSISGLLLFGFGSSPPIVIGVLHPNPVRPFDRSLLPGVEFCALEGGYDKGKLSVCWV